METKLIKVEDVYRLIEVTKNGNRMIATSDLEYQKTWADYCKKLCVDNCIEIGLNSEEQGVWDVEIEMRPASLVYKTEEILPKLDKNLCLILKRKTQTENL
jgi:hypothetical protein